jgi:hypothetical protein
LVNILINWFLARVLLKNAGGRNLAAKLHIHAALKNETKKNHMELLSSSPEKNESASPWSCIVDFSRAGFAVWVWAELIRCHDTTVLCFLGVALTLLQADPCYVLNKLLKKFRWAFGFSLALWLILAGATWIVVYKNSRP